MWLLIATLIVLWEKGLKTATYVEIWRTSKRVLDISGFSDMKVNGDFKLNIQKSV